MIKLTQKQIGITVTSLITAFLHLAAAFDRVLFPEGADPLFILNGIGYLGLLGAYMLPIPFLAGKRQLIKKFMIGFAVVTILAWLYIWVYQYVILQGVPFFSRDSWYGVPAKISELILIVFLSMDDDFDLF
ncbi:MAG: hypothetical protein WCP19_12380 [Chloroflexota bacterium]